MRYNSAMSLSAWLARREARDLVRDGRLEEAASRVASLAEKGYARAVAARRVVARAHLDRAARHQSRGDSEAAWGDLHAAESLVPGATIPSALREALTRVGVEAAAAHLAAGQPTRALDAADRLRGHGVAGPELDRLTSASAALLDAQILADRGDFAPALECLAAPGLPACLTKSLEIRAAEFRPLLQAATSAASEARWPECAQAAEAALALAPSHPGLRELRAAAWASLRGRPSPATTRHHDETPDARPSRAVTRLRSAPAVAVGGALPKRFALWVDGVGGYLVCLAPRVTVGQAIGDAPVDVPIFAELAKLHAEFARDEDGAYVLESAREARVNGERVRRAALSCGDRVTLGASCQFVFRQPVAISTTARLDVASGHRLPWAVDGIILMGQTLQLGGPGGGHLPPSEGDGPGVVLYRTPTGLAIKCPGKFRVGNEPQLERADVPLPTVVVAAGLTFALDPVSAR